MTAAALAALRAGNPLTQNQQCIDLLEQYLMPRSLAGAGARAHQMTINGLTYPFVRHYNFAAVPDVPRKRRYDMYAGLYLVAPGDLLFFFQADPQDGISGINSRRGIRGVYVATSTPYRDFTNITNAQTPINFTILGRCPNCNSFHGEFKDTCWNCGVPYPSLRVGRETRHFKVLSSRIAIEPLWAFERSVSDERTYADMTDEAVIWTGRHDNAMGPGKGSSIRHLLPEEAVKLTQLLASEPEQTIGARTPSPAGNPSPLQHVNGISIDQLKTDAAGAMVAEDQLYYLITRQLGVNNSGLRMAVAALMPNDVGWHDLEYAASTFPWGYTGGAADFVLLFRNRSGRAFLVIIECKRGAAHDEAVLQASLYVERVLQTIFLSAPNLAAASMAQPVVVQPIVIARGVVTPRGGHAALAVPRRYDLHKTIWGRNRYRANVCRPAFLRYASRVAPTHLNNDYYVSYGDFEFLDIPPARVREIDWRPPLGAVGTLIESEHILRTSWRRARIAAGI